MKVSENSRWPQFGNKTLLRRHMTSSADVADLNGNILDVLSFVVIALIFSELRGGGADRPPPPVPEDQKKPGLNRVKDSYA